MTKLSDRKKPNYHASTKFVDAELTASDEEHEEQSELVVTDNVKATQVEEKNGTQTSSGGDADKLNMTP